MVLVGGTDRIAVAYAVAAAVGAVAYCALFLLLAADNVIDRLWFRWRRRQQPG